MKRDFMTILADEGILADGAIGTEIYRRGVFINRCFDELNITNRDLIRQIHVDYLNAGARLLKTNTFTANRAALSAYGLEAKTKDINAAGVRLACKVAGSEAFVGGSVGPVSSSTSRRWANRERSALFAEQIEILADAGADVILLETFTNLDELVDAIRASKSVCDLPVLAHTSIKASEDEGEDESSLPEQAVAMMVDAGADVVGANCGDGPRGVFDTVKRMSEVTYKPVSAMPNAGLPRIVQGRMLYMATPEYLAEYAKRYAQLGVALIGGCCGTTPEHIREMKKYLKTLRPSTRVEFPPPQEREEKVKGIEPMPLEKKSHFGSVLGKKFTISVEVDPPLGFNAEEAIKGSIFLKELGVDAVNIADGPRAMPRMSPMALGTLIKERAGIEPIVHYCCRDRNVLGMQMDLLGAQALGLNNLLIITGDPPKMGHYPDATPVFDMDSIGLIKFVSNLNRGLDFANRPMKSATQLVIGCGCNPGAVDLDLEVERYRQKVAAGAEYVFSQPVYDIAMLETFLDRIKDVPQIPFFVGILPLASLKNAEFLHHEVPGMQIPDPIMDRIRKESTREGQRGVGIEVAREIVQYARGADPIQGAYIFPPFGKYELVERVLK